MADKDLEKIIKLSSLILVLLYVTGFLVWNYYLSNFGFFEAELLQTRFISAGVLTLIFPFLLLCISGKIRGEIERQTILVKVIIYLIWLFIFSIYIFPIIPQQFGGARPYISSIIANADSLKSLQTMGINLAKVPNEREPVETSKGCKIYDNTDYIVFGFVFEPSFTDSNSAEVRPNRVVILNKNQIYGFSTLPTNSLVYPLVCDPIRMVYGINFSIKQFYYRMRYVE